MHVVLKQVPTGSTSGALVGHVLGKGTKPKDVHVFSVFDRKGIAFQRKGNEVRNPGVDESHPARVGAPMRSSGQ